MGTSCQTRAQRAPWGGARWLPPWDLLARRVRRDSRSIEHSWASPVQLLKKQWLSAKALQKVAMAEAVAAAKLAVAVHLSKNPLLLFSLGNRGRAQQSGRLVSVL